MDAIQFEPMSVGRILYRTFALYRRNFLRFITIVAIIQVPISLISLTWTAMIERGVCDTPQTQARASAQMFVRENAAFESNDESFGTGLLALSMGSYVIVLLTTVVGNALCQGALTRSVSEAYLGHEITVGQTYRSVLPKLTTLIGASLLVGIVTGFGLLLLVVPGVIFAVWFFVTTPSIVVENHGVTAGMSRSKALISGNFDKAFAVRFLATAIAFAITLPISTVANLVSMGLFANKPILAVSAAQFIALIGEVLASPIPAAAAILFYYDLRIRKEGFDLPMLSQSLASNQG